MSSIGHLLVRADASEQVGHGHVMRCLALAQAWQDRGGQVSFLMIKPPAALHEGLIGLNVSVELVGTHPGSEEDAQEAARLADRTDAAWIVVDGYCFTSAYQEYLKHRGRLVLALDDDVHLSYYPADLVLNQNLHAESCKYSNCSPTSRLLLGARYVLLRREFQRWIAWRRQTADVARHVLISLGGSDPANATLKCVQGLQQSSIHDLEVVVVVGASNPHLEQLHQVARSQDCAIQIKNNVSDMTSLLRWADIAIGAGGSSTWERAFFGLPSLLIVLADNQAAIAAEAEKRGIALSLGNNAHLTVNDIASSFERLACDPNLRSQMTSLSLGLVDGQGANRVIDAMLAV